MMEFIRDGLVNVVGGYYVTNYDHTREAMKAVENIGKHSNFVNIDERCNGVQRDNSRGSTDLRNEESIGGKV